MTKTVSYRGLLLSLLALGVVGMLAGGATIAFYGDVERSTGNTFTAGGVELLVDSVSHYNNMICTDTDDDGFGDEWQAEEGFVPGEDQYPVAGSDCDGTWEETDLEDGVHKFFNFDDLKPGDFGEDTISLHVYDNPAWGRFVVENFVDADNSCTDPEQEAEDGDCSDPDGDGEIDNYLLFTAWVDHGAIPGFQCGDLTASSTGAQCDADPTEGDNIYQDSEAYVLQNEPFSAFESFEFAPLFAAAFDQFSCSETPGDTDYGDCHGFAQDGRMVPSVTYYFGLAWDLPLLETGNDAQTDTFQADMVFEVEQHRNNPDPFASDDVGGPAPDPVLALEVTPLSLTATTGEQVNFVATVTGDLGDFPDRVVAVTDSVASTTGLFFDGTVGGDCNSLTPDADNEFAISSNKGICYQNTTEGSYTVTVSVLDGPAGTQVGSSTDVTVTVSNLTI